MLKSDKEGVFVKKLTLILLIVILVYPVFALWDDGPFIVNPDAGTPNAHFNSGHSRMVRIDNISIVIVPHIGGETIWRSENNGQNWTEIDTDTQFGESGSLISGPNKTVYHFFRNSYAANFPIYMVKFKYNATIAEIPEPVSIYTPSYDASHGAYNMLNSIVDANGSLYVATHWDHDSNGNDSIFILRSDDDGNSWQGPYTLADSDHSLGFVHLAVTQDNKMISTFADYTSTASYYAESIDKGETWSTVDITSSEPNEIYNPHILAAGNNIFVFAQGESNDGTGLLYIRSDDSGMTWGNWTLIDETLGYADPGAGLGADGHTIFVAYRSSNGTNVTSGSTGDHHRSRLAVSRDLGETWTFPDDYYEGNRSGTRNNVRYQTWYNYGGPLEWMWMQYINQSLPSESHPTFYDINIDEEIYDIMGSSCNDNDGDGYSDFNCGGNDCNDSNSSIHPDAIEIFGDGIDQDCDGFDVYCQDNDNDGYNSCYANSSITDCCKYSYENQFNLALKVGGNPDIDEDNPLIDTSDFFIWGNVEFETISDLKVQSIKNINPNTTITLYRSLGEIKKDDPLLANMSEDWFIHCENGTRLRYTSYENYLPNISNPTYREFWINRTIDAFEEQNQYEGLFMDIAGATKDIMHFPCNIKGINNQSDFNEYWKPNVVVFLEEIMDALPNETVIANSISMTYYTRSNFGPEYAGFDFSDIVDGVVNEGWISNFDTDENNWKVLLNIYLDILNDGKFISLQIREDTNDSRALYGYANYLLINNEKLLLNVYSLIDKQIFDIPIGEPLENIKDNVTEYHNETIYRRDFDNGIVLVNPTGTTINYQLNHIMNNVILNDRNVSYEQVTNVSLDSQEAAILIDLGVCGTNIDCDDTNASINPGAEEICGNGVDEDCKGGDLQCLPEVIDDDGDGYNSSVDCNDTNASINPNATEILGNLIDEDCSGIADMVAYSDFDGGTTNFSGVANISAVIDPVVEKISNGKIEFDGLINFTGINLNEYIHIEKNLIGIDTHIVPQLNITANLTFYNVSINTPIVYKDNSRCSGCIVLKRGRNVTIRVIGFSNYSLGNSTPNVTSVTGNLIHKGTINIKGKYFWTKSPAKPLMWDDTEGKTLNDPSSILSEGGWNESWSGQPSHQIRDAWENQYRKSGFRGMTAPHDHSTSFISGGHWNDDTDEGRNVVVTADAGSYQNKWYASWYVRLDPLWPQNDGNECTIVPNYKDYVFQPGSTSYTGNRIPGDVGENTFIYDACTSCIVNRNENISPTLQADVCGNFSIDCTQPYCLSDPYRVWIEPSPSEIFDWKRNEILLQDTPGIIEKYNYVGNTRTEAYNFVCPNGEDLVEWDIRSFSVGGFMKNSDISADLPYDYPNYAPLRDISDHYHTWVQRGSSDEYYVIFNGSSMNDSDDDPWIGLFPEIVRMGGMDFNSSDIGEVGSLNYGEWNYGDFDGLGFNTTYVRLPNEYTERNPGVNGPCFIVLTAKTGKGNGRTQPDAFRYFDDIYIDNTFARVILTNNATYNFSTIVEPQIPFNWSNSSINVTVNLGKLNGSTAYLFVFDSENNHNEVGYPIAISEQEEPICEATNGRCLYVHPDGNDSVSYENNSFENPWRTPERVWGYLNGTTYDTVYYDPSSGQDVVITDADLPQAGDYVYFRGGTYNITRELGSKYDGNAGTTENPIIFKNYNGEYVLFNGSDCVDDAMINIVYSHYYVDGLNGIGGGNFWYVGFNNAEDSNFFRLSNVTGKTLYPGGSPNYGFVHFAGSDANNGTVEDCVLIGPGGELNVNTAGVFVFRSQGVKIMNNEFYDYPRAIYYKHTCVGRDTGIEMRYNYFENCSSGIYTVSQYTDIENNLFVNASLVVSGGTGGCGDDGDNCGGDHNFVRHNTIYGGNLVLDPSFDGDASGPQYNLFRENLILERVELIPWTYQDHQSTMDYNLYPSGNAVLQNGTFYDLNEWQVYYGQDEDSLEGRPTFVNISDMTSIIDFALTNTSLGHRSASEGTDIGANVSCVGIGKSCNLSYSIEEEPICEASSGYDCWYVSTTGNDTNNGSFESPFLTVQYGLDNMGSGDMLYIMGGTYYEQNLTPPAGVNSSYLTKISGYPGSYPVIDANATAGTHSTAMIINNDYITVQYLDLRNGGGHEDGTISIGSDSFPPYVGEVSDVTIDHCKISGTNTGGTTNFYNPCHIRISYGGFDFKDITISNCEIFGNYSSGLKINSIGRGNNTLITNNYIHDVVHGIAVKWGDELDKNFTIINNYINNCSERGIYADQSYLHIFNNIIGRCDLGIRFKDNFGGNNCSIIHNTIYGSTTYAFNLATGSDNIFNDNIYYNSSSIYNNGNDNIFNNNLVIDPMFIDHDPSSISGYELNSSSPGYRNASDETDIGANVSCVGIGKHCNLRYVTEEEPICEATNGSCYYVDNKTTSTNWTTCSNISTPCTPNTSMMNAQAGDIVYFRGGIYVLGEPDYWQHSYLMPANSGTKEDPITFKAYPEEIPLLIPNCTLKITGIADAGSNNSYLIDNDVNFTELGIEHWDIVRTISKPGGAAVYSETDSVTDHSIEFYPYGGSHNSINLTAGDEYEIGSDISSVIGVYHEDYIILDGFHVNSTNRCMGRIKVTGSDYTYTAGFSHGNVVRNCVIDGGNRLVVHGDNREGLFIANTINTTIEDTEIFGFQNINNNHNTGAIKMYHNNYTTIQNCEIHDSVNGIFDKSDGNHQTYRNNFIHHCNQGIFFTSFAWTGFSSNHKDIEIYNNLIIHTTGSALRDSTEEWSNSDDMVIHDNTIYSGNNISSSVNLGAEDKVFYNNIIQGLPVDNDIRNLRFTGRNNYPSRPVLVDHNNFGDKYFGTKVVRSDGGSMRYTSYTTLNDWQTSDELENGSDPGAGTIAQDPLFVNISGTMEEIKDFALDSGSPCIGTGRNGTDMGANVSCIGIGKECDLQFADVKYCGDGICIGSENCSNCFIDCGECSYNNPLWESTFDCSLGSPTGCDDLIFGLDGDCGTTKIDNLSNYQYGQGGNGYRFYQCSGENNISQTYIYQSDKDVNEIWVRFYMRYEEGLRWNETLGFSDDKLLEIRNYPLEDRVVVHWEPDGFGIWNNGGDSLNYNGNISWNDLMTGPYYGSYRETDNEWHSYEVYLKKGDTGKYNGIVRAWLDDDLVVENESVEYGFDSQGWNSIVVGENNKYIDGKGQQYYIDYDDIKVVGHDDPSLTDDGHGNLFIDKIKNIPICEAPSGYDCWYVSTTGNDTNNGSFTSPFRTIQHAVDTMDGGDIIYLRNGTYYESAINLLNKDGNCTNTSCINGSWSTIKSYPGDWGIIDGELNNDYVIGYETYENHCPNPTCISYWIFEKIEIMGGSNAGIWITGGPFIVRYTYIHDNYAATGGNNPGGLYANVPMDSIVEYNLFDSNGCVDTAGSNCAQIQFVDDYSITHEDMTYEETLNIGIYDPTSLTARNEVRYNLFLETTDRAVKAWKNKASQSIVPHAPNGTLPEQYKDFGDKIHHNIVLGDQQIEINQDLGQVYNNIVTDGHIAVGYVGEFVPLYVNVYNNYVRELFYSLPSAPMISSLEPWQQYYYLWLPLYNVSFRKDWSFNNIIDNGVDIDRGRQITIQQYMCNVGDTCDSRSYPYNDSTILNLDEFYFQNNYIYRPDNDDDVWNADLATPGHRDIGNITVWESNYENILNNYRKESSEGSDNLTQGTIGAYKYITRADHSLGDGNHTIADGGIGIMHPYLDDVFIPSYVGAVNPDDHDWVAGVIGLENITSLMNANGTPDWIEADYILSTYCGDGICNGTENCSTCPGDCGNCSDIDGDGYNSTVDCDDTNSTVYPGAREICDDGIDQNCDSNDLHCKQGNGTLILKYGFEDWGGDISSTPDYIFTDLYGEEHSNTTEVLSSCNNWSASEGDYYFYGNWYDTFDSCLANYGGGPHAILGDFDNNADFDLNEALNGSVTIYIRYKVLLDPEWKNNTNYMVKFLRTTWANGPAADDKTSLVMYNGIENYMTFFGRESPWAGEQKLDNFSIDFRDGTWHDFAMFLNTTGLHVKDPDHIFGKVWVDNQLIIARNLTINTDYIKEYGSRGISSFNILENFCGTTNNGSVRYALDDIEIWDGIPLPINDTQKPTYYNIQINNTNVGETTGFSIDVDDNIRLHTKGQYIFSFDNCLGYFNNDSAINFSTTPQSISSTKTINSTIGCTIRYRWYLTDDANNTNQTMIYNFTTTIIDLTAPIFTTAPINDTITYGTDWPGTDFDATDISGIDSYSVNDTRFTINRSGYLDTGIIAAGSYILNISINDTKGNNNSTLFTLIVYKADPILSLVVTNATYPNNCTINASGDQDLIYRLHLETSEYSGRSINISTTLGAGSYDIVYNTTGNENYTSSSIIKQLNISKGILNATFVNSGDSLFIYGENTINISINETNIGDSDVIYQLYKNNLYVGIDDIESNAGSYTYVINSTGGVNWSETDIITMKFYLIEKANNTLNLSFNTPINYGTEANVSCTSTYGTPYLYRNNTLVSNPDLTILSAGNWSYDCNISETQNYISNSIEDNLTIYKRQGIIHNYIDSARSSKTVRQGDEVLLEAKLIQGTFGRINISLNGTIVNTSTQENISFSWISINGTYLINTSYSGTQNYTEDSESWSLTVLPPDCISDSDCDDGLYCNGNETCTLGSCNPGIPLNTSDSISCTIDSCDEANDILAHTANHSYCSNGLFCDGSEICNLSQGCTTGVAPDIDDNESCTVDSCNETTDQIDNIPIDFDVDGYNICSGPFQDCDDSNKTINPGATEECYDFTDNDCDGSIDCSDSNCTTHYSCESCTGINWTWADLNSTVYVDYTNVSIEVLGYARICNMTTNTTSIMDGTYPTWWQMLTGYSDGQNNFSVTCYDRIGGSCSSDAFWIINTSYPDLTFENLTVSDDNPTEGTTVDIVVNISKTGKEITRNFTFILFIDGSEVYTVNLTNETRIVYSWKSIVGVHNITAIVDSSNIINESIEDNNILTYLLDVNKKNTGGSSGSSGGGGSISVIDNSLTRSWYSPDKDKEFNWDIPHSMINKISGRFTESKDEGTIKIDFPKLDTPWNEYSFFNIDHDIDLGQGIIEFSVNRSWAFGKDIRLARKTVSWHLLKTDLIGYGEKYRYRAITPGFSSFAIVEIEPEETDMITEVPSIEKNGSQNIIPEIVDEKKIDPPTKIIDSEHTNSISILPQLIAVLLSIMVILIAIGFYLLRPIQRREPEKPEILYFKVDNPYNGDIFRWDLDSKVVRRIMARYAESRDNCTISLGYSDNKTPWPTYSCFDIKSDIRFNQGIIGFVVHSSWAEKLNIRLAIFDEQWIILDTKLIQIGEFYYFRAYTHKFGNFAVVATGKHL